MVQKCKAVKGEGGMFILSDGAGEVGTDPAETENQAQVPRKKSQHKFLTYRPNCITFLDSSVCVNCISSGFVNCLEIFCG